MNFLWQQFRGVCGTNPSAATQADANLWAQCDSWSTVKAALDRVIRATVTAADLKALGFTGSPPLDKPPPVVQGVPHWYQAGIPTVSGYPGNFWGAKDVKYDSIPLPDGTIRAKGCGLTALTIVANFWKGNTQDPTGPSPLDPGKINDWSGLYCTSSGKCRGDIEWNVFATAAKDRAVPLVRLYPACPTSNPYCGTPNNSFPVFPDPRLTLDNILRNGVPVILPIFVWQVDPITKVSTRLPDAVHFVVVTGRTPTGDYFVIDVGDKNMTTLGTLENHAVWWHANETLDLARSLNPNNYFVFVGLDPATGTYKALDRKDPSTAQALGIYSADPVEFVLTDPQGRRAGFDPVSNTSFQEIPTSAYSSTLYRDDLNLSAPDPPPFKALDMANQMPGQYTLDVIGTGSGDFTVEVRASDAAGNWITQTYSGTTAPGASSRFTFPGAVTTLATFSANVAISQSTNGFAVGGLLSVSMGSLGIDPLTQPVTLQVGAFLITIPAGFFQLDPSGSYVFFGTINGVQVAAGIQPQGGTLYAYGIAGLNASNLPTANPVDVRLAIGNTGGNTSATATFVP
jgi:hypothetical protein